MRVVIAPDKFKGSLSAPDVAEHLATGLQAGVRPTTLKSTRIPVADGGEGTIDAAIGSGFTRRTTTVTGPLGEPVKADFAVRDQEAVIEMAAASGLALLPDGPTSRNGQDRHQHRHGRTHPRRAGPRLPQDHPGCRRQRQHRRRRRSPAGPRRRVPGQERQRAPRRRCGPRGHGQHRLLQLRRPRRGNGVRVGVRRRQSPFGGQRSPSHLRSAEGRDAGRRRRTGRRSKPLRRRPRSHNRASMPSTPPRQKALEQQAALATLPSRH